MSDCNVHAGSLFSLSYVSSAIRELGDDEAVRLLTAARCRNHQRRISGMLLYKEGDFMQVLEGPKAAVEEVFASISRDARHRSILVLWRKVIGERAFADWSMSFHRLTGSTVIEVEGYKPLAGLSFLDERFRARPDAAYELLLSFRERPGSNSLNRGNSLTPKVRPRSCDSLEVASVADVVPCDPSERTIPKRFS